ncbi:DNA starvation/stationary phase protection protein [Streptomyces sp. NPDC053741]|jgi:starvation-inducible DNA-binding protein|uniref:Ferritin Dps family protein n=2 Tax=Streptomyces TaxID=1883 RepID=A0A8D4BA94_STRFA|nr:MULTISPECIES: DNA starvation/stationary phase protection protein [Streptomyces]MBD2835387.1 DNA starvation/stationary phase protection protein [Streptomyces pratensis]AGJ59051.1 non-specific DNA-binding protein Dps / Iron-binding ferritin-like antioxidant protein / Ferroxidase [Streptomyces sp. PAMC 26508]MCX4416532.1 DNA starvation/stationary phase protection protein [[Kitasatospora] papulosa]MCY1655161.1 DNA starvation/stationary phase protection protein [Streptomyces sp. SL203]MCY1677503
MPPQTSTPRYTVPGLSTKDGGRMIDVLRMRLHALNDLALTLKHIHWNVTGPHFIAVHEMLDPQTLAVRDMADGTAERISALGGVPHGTAGVLVSERTWEDYSVGRADAIAHLGALDLVYTGIIEDHRKAAAKAASLDPVTEDLLIEHLRSLEQFQWFVRAHLENSAGVLATTDARSEKQAAAAAGTSRTIPAKQTASPRRTAKKSAVTKRGK